MMTALFIGVPLFLIVAGTLAALSFSVDPEEMVAAQPAVTANPSAEQPMAFADLLAPPALANLVASPTTEKKPPNVEQLLAEIESHLRHERAAAAQFAEDPSSRALWLN